MMKRLLFIIALSVATTFVALSKAPKSYDNPILSGYYPDPSICRAGDEFYLINSSFEWFPGIPIHKSRDLVNWELIGYAMDRNEQCFKGKINIFAPTIRYHDGLFYIITTNVGSGGNFYITAKDPAGEWSNPTWLPDAPGIDPSIFWDDDGRCYYIGQQHANPRLWTGHNHIWIQELDLKEGKLVGERKNVTSGHAANAMWTEGPHLYKIDGKYLLLLAEGGTSYHHAVTIFHSDNLWGPYTPDHANPILTHRHLGEDYHIYATGHADFVDTPNGEWWMVSLGKRLRNGHVYLARETFLSPMKLESRKRVTAEEPESYQTIIINEGKGTIPDSHALPNLPWSPVEPIAERDDFNGNKLSSRWNFRFPPQTEWHSLKDGRLTIDLQAGIASKRWDYISLVAQRITDYCFEASTQLEFKSAKSGEQVGLILYRNFDSYALLSQKDGEIILESTTLGEHKEHFRAPFTESKMRLKLVSDGKDVTFYYSALKGKEVKIGSSVPLSVISDLLPNFYNGPMVGIYCSSNGAASNNKASFDWFELSYK